MGQSWGTAGGADAGPALLACEREDDEGGRLTAQLRFLTDVTDVLAASLDDDDVVSRLARLVVPAVADWCAVHLMEPGEQAVKRVAVVHVDPRKQVHAEQLLAPELHHPTPGHAVSVAVRGLASQLVEGSGALAPDGPPEAIAVYEKIGTDSVLTVPLVARGRPVGALTLALGDSGRRYRPDDIAMVDELARRCALAVDNARLYQDARRLLTETDNALALLDTVFANAPIGLAFLDADGRILKANEAMRGMDDLPDRERTALHRRVVDTGGALLDIEIARDGSAWLTSWFPVRNHDGSLLGVGVVVRDVSDRKRADAELARRVAQQAAVAALGRSALSVDIDELLRLAPRVVAESLGVAHSALLEQRRSGEDVIIRAGYGCRPEVIGRVTIPVTPGTEAGYTLLTGGPVIVDDYATEARFPAPASLVEQGFASGMTVVVRHRSGSWGVLSAHSPTAGRFTPQDVDFLESVATVLGEAVGRAAADDELRRRARQQAAVAEFGRSAIVGTPVAELYRQALATLTSILGVSHAAVVEQVGHGNGMVRAVLGWPADSVGQVVPAGTESQAGYTLLAKEPVVVEDIRTETRFRPAPLTLAEKLVSSMSTVVRGIGRDFGVLSVHTREQRRFTPDDVYFLRSIANVLAAAMGRSEAEEELRQERERLRLALDAGRMGDWEWDVATDTVTWSDSLERMFGLLPGTFGRTFDDYVELIHPDDRERTVSAIRRALDERRQFNVEHRVRFPDGSLHWINGIGRAVLADDGTPKGMIGVAGDVTERVEADRTRSGLLAAEQAARREAEAARSRLEFLAEASVVLSTSLNYRRTLAKVANLAVPRLADWCAVDVIEDDHGPGPNHMAIAHADPEKVALAREMQRRYPVDSEAKRGLPFVIRTATSQLVPVVEEGMLLEAARDEEHLAMLRELGLRSAMIVPLVARGRSIGAITLVSAESERVYGPDDLALAEDLARRAAAAIDNARLYQERSVVARALQRSLLPPEIPFISGLEVADRYRPMSEQSEIGGDFYDVFEASDGSWCFVVGDVCGKGPEAAAVTGLARSTLRAVALHNPAPATVLGLLNEALYRNHEDSRFCTVAFARVVPGAGGATATVSCGGHPLPLLVRRDGRVEAMGRAGTLLGVFEQATLGESDSVLSPGDALVFYTDGVTEARREGEVYGETRLAELLRTVAGAEPDVIADAIEDAVVTWQPEHRGDDLALLVIRVPAA